ncbi:serine/threonine protein kinase [Stieleria sp. ICT_E10.1]|uniref:serine/threonine-protein kinase n=1 Tax=Stieleria sedimenti TaxID=2976331 RepID=UPI00218058FF|nr:serine/threonine protein kinase [Stieleria sedimenti]MCS7465522.1 serine/threonine protein kinase [Stieleria sedimenti]
MTPNQYGRVKELFLRVVDLGRGERERVLENACADDPELRAAVDSLLEHDDSRTIIRSAETTVADFSPKVLTAPRRKLFGAGVERWWQFTHGLGRQGQLALGGLISCLVLALIGFLVQRYIGQLQKEVRRETLNEIVDSNVLALKMWLDHEVEKAESWARSNRLRQSVGELIRITDDADDLSQTPLAAPIHFKIRSEITALAGREEHFAIWDRRYRLIADSISGDNRIGHNATPWGSSILASVFAGRSELFPLEKDRSITPLDESTAVIPHLAIVTPLRNADGRVIAALQIHDSTSREKAMRITQAFRLGESGETYVFDRDGQVLSASRFDRQLEQAGLIPTTADTSVRHTYLHDPGGDTTAGYQFEEPASALPLTKMARMCLSGNDGSDVDGYRDFRGVMVVGAWRWLDDLQVGVATEFDADEVDPSAGVTRVFAFAVMVQSALCLCIAVGSYYSINRLRHRFGEDQKLGQYRLEKQIGEGGMGKVFKAQHELLKRPTAIKLLKPQFSDSDSIARFQREARSVSQLEHFNTVRVLDYGVSEERIFYLVMEYIDGLTLSHLVELETAIEPSRAVFLLRQVLYSLREAHNAGLVHRDLKPGNVMICIRGGTSDVVKVLDFGLAKPIHTTTSQLITESHLVAGTPQYLAPERLHDLGTNDPRSDLFSFGAVAFFLLTGRNAVDGQSIAEILHQLANVPPSRPSEHTARSIPAALDDLVFRCLSKDPNDRPGSAQQLIDQLDGITDIPVWSESQADQWWAKYRQL